ncbi:MAG: monovalent cation/H(+) antiporter subunit G [Rubrivivax sp.]|nr:monovalent cation/H(+) antiporter subunit G [Rubrivivax sp.]
MSTPLVEIVVAVLLLASGVVVLLAASGLVRLADFFQRLHAPALASSLASWIVTLAAIVHFSSRGEALALHTWLVIVVLSITAPVTTIVLARAALFRRRQVGDALPPPLGARARDRG